MSTKQELEVENTQLREKIAELETEIASWREKFVLTLNEETAKVAAELNQALVEEKEKLAKSARGGCPSGDHAVYKGQPAKIVVADLAWEIGQKVEKGYVDENQTCLVLDAYGG